MRWSVMAWHRFEATVLGDLAKAPGARLNGFDGGGLMVSGSFDCARRKVRDELRSG